MALEAGLVPFFCWNIPGPDLPDEIFFPTNFIFKNRHAAADIVDLMGIVPARLRQPEAFHRFPDFRQGFGIMVRVFIPLRSTLA